MIVIACALPDESRLLRRELRPHGVAEPAGSAILQRGTLRGREVALFHTGMGAARVRERFEALCPVLQTQPTRLLLSIGYAGGINPSLEKSQCMLGGNVSTPALLAEAQRVLGARAVTGAVCLSPNVLETPAAKAAFAATGADAVDMETEALAALCSGIGLPFLSLRVISDTAGEELAVPFSVCFDAATEKPRPGALLAYLARHPGRIAGFARFVRDMSRVRHRLAEATLALAEAL